jgi:spore coat protein U-like protein
MHAKSLLSIPGLLLAALLIIIRPATAVGACAFDSTIGVNFGSYDVFNTVATDSTGSITYTCTSVPSPITIDLSKGSAPTYIPRQMRKAVETLSYNLYLDAARILVWGDGTGSTSRYGPVVPLLVLPVTVPIYGRIPARQNLSVGSYTDTITATINF